MAISLVQSRSSTQPSVASLSLAYATNTTAGNLLIAIAAGGDAVGFTLSGGGTWQSAIKQDDSAGSASAAQCGIWYIPNCAGGAVTVQVASTGNSTDLHLHIYEVSGIATSTPLDATGKGKDTSGTAHSVTTTTSVAQASEYGIAAFFSWNVGTGQTFAGGSGYTTRQTTNSTGGDSLGSMDQIYAAASGTETASVTFGSADTEVPKVIATFKGAAGGATAFDIPQLGMMGVGF